MSESSKDCKLTPACLLLPVGMLAFVLFIMLAFQVSQIMRDRDSLNQVKQQQEKPLEDVQKLRAQLDAVAVGTLKLSQNGNKDAKAIIDRMKRMGIVVNSGNPASGGAPAAAMPGSVPNPPASN